MALQQEIVKALLAEMREKLEARNDASVIYFSQVLKTFTQVPVSPEQIAFNIP